jgi:hypothetical protein
LDKEIILNLSRVLAMFRNECFIWGGSNWRVIRTASHRGARIQPHGLGPIKVTVPSRSGFQEIPAPVSVKFLRHGSHQLHGDLNGVTIQQMA